MFLTLSVACLWLILDEFFGDKRVSGVVMNLTPDFENPIKQAISNALNGDKTLSEKVEAKENAKDYVDKNMKSSDSVKSEIKNAIDQYWLERGIGST